MQKISIYLACLSLFFMSCSNDDDYVSIISLVTVTEGADEAKLFLRSDSALLMATNFDITSDVGQRMLIQYRIEGVNMTNDPYEYSVIIEDYKLVLTKGVVNLTTDNEEAIGNDAFWDIYYMNSSGGYLNVYLSFLYNYNPHYINLIRNTITPPANTPDSIFLELRQNANGDNIGFPVSELVSFDVNDYIEEAKAEGVEVLILSIKTNLGNGEYSTYNVPFNISTPNDESITYNVLSSYAPIEGALE